MQIMKSDIDWLSTEAHINVECPVCGEMWVEKVSEGDNKTKCDCKMPYKMKKLNNGQVELSFSIKHNQ